MRWPSIVPSSMDSTAMYGILRRHMSVRAATMLMGAWYALLVVLVLWSIVEPQVEFRYVEL